MPTGKKTAQATKPEPASANTSAEPQSTADHKSRITLSDTAMDAQNWRIIKPLLADRIRRRRLALRRLAGEEETVHATENLMVAESGDAAALWQLAEQLDSRLDRAFAPRARRVPFQDKPNHPGRSTGHDDYKAH